MLPLACSLNTINSWNWGWIVTFAYLIIAFFHALYHNLLPMHYFFSPSQQLLVLSYPPNMCSLQLPHPNCHLFIYIDTKHHIQSSTIYFFFQLCHFFYVNITQDNSFEQKQNIPNEPSNNPLNSLQDI